MTTLRGSRLIEICTPSISYDNQVQAASTAFDRQMWEIIDDTGSVLFIPNILNITDSNLIDILAWQFHVDFYDPTAPLEFRRALVQNSIVWHRTKGTVQLVNDVINTYWPGGGYIQEWFKYRIPFPPNFPTVSVDELAGEFRPQDVNLPNDKFNVGIPLVNDEAVKFQLGATGNTLPAPLVVGTVYYIVNAATNSFQVAATVGGTPIDLTSTGTGTNQIWDVGSAGGSWHDRYRFRVIRDGNVIPDSEVPALIDLISRYKPISRWPEGETITSTSSTGTVYASGFMTMSVNYFSDAPPIRTGIPTL